MADTSIAALLDAALRAALIPIRGVSVGDPANRATWTVQFDPSATETHRADAATLLATIAVDAAALHAEDQRNVKAYIQSMSLLDRAVNLTILDQVNVIRSKLPTPLAAITVQQWLDAVKTKVDQL